MATVKITKAMAGKAKAEIDWRRCDATTDEDIAAQVAGNPDAAPLLTDEEIERALFADRVRAIRAALHLSQAAFAERFAFRRRACAIGSRGAGCRTPRRKPISP
jgi:putative transcriptional regulator